MNETRTVGQELQDHVLAVARKGQQRISNRVKNVTATAQLIRPQLPSLPKPTLNVPNLPKPTLNVPSMPTPAQIREKAPQLTAMLPSAEQFRASAHELAGQILSAQRKMVDQVRSFTTPLMHQAEVHELAGQFMSAQRKMVDQVRSFTTPLAQQAAAVFTQIGKPTEKATATRVAVNGEAGTDHRKAEQAKAEPVSTEHGKAENGKAEHGKAEHGRTAAQHNGPGARKPRTKSTAK